MRIPKIQELLREKAVEHNDPEIARLADELSRRRPKDVAPRSSAHMTDELADRIRAYKAAHPHATQNQIAIRYQVNQGRVSEALRGHRQ